MAYNYTWISTIVGGVSTVNRTLGVSPSSDLLHPEVSNTGVLSSSIENELYSLVIKVTNFTTVASVTTNDTPSYAYGINAGQSGHIGLFPSARCVKGIFEACTGSGYPASSFAAEVCSPYPEGANYQCTVKGKNEYPCYYHGTVRWVDTPLNETNQTICWACENERRLTAGAVASALSKGNWLGLVMGTVSVAVWVTW